MKANIKKLIREYADVYKQFEDLQKGTNPVLAGGDQKTGVIAEYYAKCYIEKINGVLSAEYARPGEFYDIKYTDKNGKKLLVQVKGVSAHSKTRTIAPLNLRDTNGKPYFDELFLIDLDFNFLPVGFYVNTSKEITEKVEDPGRNRIVGSKMKNLNNTNKGGSSIYNFRINKVNELLKAIN